MRAADARLSRPACVRAPTPARGGARPTRATRGRAFEGERQSPYAGMDGKALRRLARAAGVQNYVGMEDGEIVSALEALDAEADAEEERRAREREQRTYRHYGTEHGARRAPDDDDDDGLGVEWVGRARPYEPDVWGAAVTRRKDKAERALKEQEAREKRKNRVDANDDEFDDDDDDDDELDGELDDGTSSVIVDDLDVDQYDAIIAPYLGGRRYEDPELIVLDSVRERLPSMHSLRQRAGENGKDLKTLVYKARLKLNRLLTDASSVEEVLSLAELARQEFGWTTINLCTALHRLAKRAREEWPEPMFRVQVCGDTRATHLIAEMCTPERLAKMDVQGLSNVTWAVATLAGKFRLSEPLAVLAGEATHRLAKAEELERASERMPRKVRFEPRQVAQIAWALGHCTHEDAACFDQLLAFATRHLVEFKPRELASLLWGAAALGIEPPEAFAAPLRERCAMLPAEMADGASGWGMREAATVLWSIASFEYVDEDGASFADAWRGACALAANAEPRRLDLLQLHQALLARRDVVDARNLLAPPDAKALAEKAQAMWDDMLATEFRSSTYAEDVDKALSALGYVPFREDTTSGLAVDFMLNLDGASVAVEVDGPTHLNRTTLAPNGKTRLKQRMLRSMGYACLSVPYHHWDLLRSPEAQIAYMEERLAGVLSGSEDGTAREPATGDWDDAGARALGEELAAQPGGLLAGTKDGRGLPSAVANARQRAQERNKRGGRKHDDGWVDLSF